MYAKLRGLNCEMRVLPNTGTLADLWASGALGSEPSSCVLALDFDQTLTQVDKTAAVGQQLKMRGGEAARRALHEMHAAGVTLLIITAQAPSVQTLLNLVGELRHLGIHSLFGLETEDELAVGEPGTPEGSPSTTLLSGSSSISVAAAAAASVPLVVTLDGGIKIARMANLLAARYNKPEAFEYWLTHCAPIGKPPPTQLAFLDDNSDNAVSMFMHFAASEMMKHEESPSPSAAAEPSAAATQQRQQATHSAPCIPICAMWYPPPAASKGETFDEGTRALLLSEKASEMETPSRKPLSPPGKPAEELGFYMPDSPFAKMDGDFYADKKFALVKLSDAQKENDVVSLHHQGRKWSMTLALMTMKTGAFRPLPSFCKTPYGGHDEDGIDLLIPESKIRAAKEDARMKLRVASRKAHANPSWFAAEQKKINQELFVKIGRPNLPQKRNQAKSPGSPDGSPVNVMQLIA